MSKALFPAMPHQVEAFERFKDDRAFALWWQQRVRKSRVILDVFRYRYHRDPSYPLYADLLLVIANPNGVQHVWTEEVEKHFPEEDRALTRVLTWRSGKMVAGKAREDALDLRPHPGMAILAMNADAIKTDAGNDYVRWLLRRRRAMMVLDECSAFASWSARTRRMLALGNLPNVTSRALTEGTPVDESPVDVFYPCRFLDAKLLGYPNVGAFKARYVRYEEEEIAPGVFTRKRFYNHKTETEFEREIGYANLPELHDKLDVFGSRLLRSDVSLSPGPTYRSCYFELTPRQRNIYDRLRDEYVIELRSGELPIANVLTRLGRLQMIARNYLPPTKRGTPCAACDESGFVGSDECPSCDGLGRIVELTDFERIDTVNPALDAIVADVRSEPSPTVIWAAHVQEVRDLIEVLPRSIAYFGPSSERERREAYDGFRAGRYDHIIATESSGLSRGHDLTRAERVFFYSNLYSLRHRRQAQDRTESLDRTISTGVVDLIAAGTNDLRRIEALREKRSIAALVMGDPDDAWI